MAEQPTPEDSLSLIYPGNPWVDLSVHKDDPDPFGVGDDGWEPPPMEFFDAAKRHPEWDDDEALEKALPEAEAEVERQDRIGQIMKYDTSSLESTPGDKDNWIEAVGGDLPAFVRAVAHALIRQGRPKSQAIGMAIGTIKRWAAGGGNVTAKTRAKAAKTVAQWEALKAKAAAK